VKQGLYHPLQCLPILIALETSDEDFISQRALELHRVLHGKHSVLVNVRFLDFAKESWTYQRTITAEVTGHRNGVALLQGWYSMVCEKKAWKIEFLRSMVKAFDYDISGTNPVSWEDATRDLADMRCRSISE
jgi:cohesin loading factor subunit SCC2